MVDKLDLSDLNNKDEIVNQFKTLRDECPVYWSEQYNAWIITRYDDVDSGLRDHKTYSCAYNKSLVTRDILAKNNNEINTTTYSVMDPPESLKQRKIYSELIDISIKNGIEDFIKENIDLLFNNIKNKNNVNFITEVTNKVVTDTIWKMLEFSDEYRDDIKHWSELFWIPNESELRVDLYRNAARFIVNASPGIFNYEYNFKDVLNYSMGLLVGGSCSMSNALPNLLLNAYKYPDQIKLIINNTYLIDNFINESLRHSFMYTHLLRTATKNFIKENSLIKQGDSVAFFMSSANFDENYYGDDVNNFSIERDFRNINLVFGNGPHLCIGYKIAMLQLKLFLEKIIEIYDSITILNISNSTEGNFTGGTLTEINGSYNAR